ncbi:hypothetical protein G3O06_23475 [Burkholderia sp. Ac-20345]|uniref:hypothetical protein n=1 Tax=Burkholderia sp. Ac-20345 TaxID=2703891 RepID=UPI00197B9F07|nr:hypothetical protein [Burkholderia sp. Ac-20345]MBN3780478.1 hypothetical protein [Burkholderia sp. Ac-20345]
MNSRPPTNVREALAAQALEEIDGAIGKVEDLTLRVDQLAATIGAQSDALAASAQNVREAVTTFSAQAKTELKDFLQAAASKTADEQRAALQEAARAVLRQEMAALRQELGDARSAEKSGTRLSHLFAAMLVAWIVGIVIAAGLIGLFKVGGAIFG